MMYFSGHIYGRNSSTENVQRIPIISIQRNSTDMSALMTTLKVLK